MKSAIFNTYIVPKDDDEHSSNNRIVDLEEDETLNIQELYEDDSFDHLYGFDSCEEKEKE